MPVLLVTVPPPINKPSAPVSLLIVKLPVFVIKPLRLIPVPLLTKFIVPLFNKVPVVLTSNSPPLLLIAKVPLGLETSPVMLTPEAPVLLIVILLFAA